MTGQKIHMGAPPLETNSNGLPPTLRPRYPQRSLTEGKRPSPATFCPRNVLSPEGTTLIFQTDAEGGRPVAVLLDVPGETRCRNWPRSCAEVQASTPTAFPFCAYCLYGPEEAPRRGQ